MQNLSSKQNIAQNQGKKTLSVVLSVLLCTLTVVSVLLSLFIVSLSLSKTPENTLELFGHKLYCAQNDIEEASIKAGSLVVVKDTDTDDYYTHESLSKNIVFSIENLGYIIQNDFVWMTLCFTAPLMALFLLILLSELKKMSAKKKNEDDKLILELNEEIKTLQSESDDEIEVTL